MKQSFALEWFVLAFVMVGFIGNGFARIPWNIMYLLPAIWQIASCQVIASAFKYAVSSSLPVTVTYILPPPLAKVPMA